MRPAYRFASKNAPGPEPEVPSLFEPGELGDYAGYVWRAVRRRRRLALRILLAATLGTAAVVVLFPRKYDVETRILALPPEGAPGSAGGSYGSGQPDSLSQGAVMGILTRDFLTTLARERNLLVRWEATRPPVLRVADQLRELNQVGARDEAARLDALVTVLDRALRVEVKENTVVFSLRWQDPQSAVEVVEAVGRHFIESRRTAELVPLTEKLVVLEGRVAETQQRISTTVEQLEATLKQRREGAQPATLRGVQAEGHWRSLPDARLSELRVRLLSKRKVIKETQEMHHRRLVELDTLRTEQRATFGPGHPTLRETEARYAALERQGKEVEALQGEERELLAEYVQRGGKDSDLSDEPPAWSPELQEDNQAMGYSKARLSMELEQLHLLLMQAAEAQVGLATGRVAFPERYRVVEPARMPLGPSSPKVLLLWLAGMLGGVLMAVFAAVAVDVRGGVIREAWQVERLLGTPLLAEVPVR